MKKALSIVLLEDVVADAVLINHELQRGGLSATAKRVETREQFLDELEHHEPDLILSDHGLPTFDGFTALRVAKERHPDIPFIFVAQASGPEEVIRSYQGGASDFVLKSQMLGQLVPAIRQAFARAKQTLGKAEMSGAEVFRLLVESHPDLALFFIDAEGKILTWNAGAEKMTGLKQGDATTFADLFISEDTSNRWPQQLIAAALDHGHVAEESVRMRKRDGQFWASLWVHAL